MWLGSNSSNGVSCVKYLIATNQYFLFWTETVISKTQSGLLYQKSRTNVNLWLNNDVLFLPTEGFKYFLSKIDLCLPEVWLSCLPRAQFLSQIQLPEKRRTSVDVKCHKESAFSTNSIVWCFELAYTQLIFQRQKASNVSYYFNKELCFLCFLIIRWKFSG
jgi:hypothetical protein